MTTVPVPSAEMTVGRQGHYAGAVSRLVAFAADVGASWGVYTLGVALLNAAVKLVTGHSYTLSNHQILALIVLGGLGVRLLRLPMGGQRKDARHGPLRSAGGDDRRRAHQWPPGRPADDRARAHPAHAGHRLPRHRVPARAPCPQRLHRRHHRRLRLGRPGRAVALDGPPGGSPSPGAGARGRGRPSAALGGPESARPAHLRCRACPSPKSAGPTPGSPSSRSTGQSA